MCCMYIGENVLLKFLFVFKFILIRFRVFGSISVDADVKSKIDKINTLLCEGGCFRDGALSYTEGK